MKAPENLRASKGKEPGLFEALAGILRDVARASSMLVARDSRGEHVTVVLYRLGESIRPSRV